MSTVQLDIIDGSSLRETKDGLEATRTATVSGLTGSAHAIQYRALEHPNMPRRGDEHPSVPGIYVDERAVSSVNMSTGTVRVTLQYRQISAEDIVDGAVAVIEVGSGLSTEQTSRDKSGDLITISHQVERLDDAGNVIGTDTVTQVATVSKQIPRMSLRYRRKESVDPASKARAFVGTVGYFGNPSGGSEIGPRWMCTAIDGSTQDGGVTWEVLYEFQYAREGWRARIDPIDPNTGQPYLTGRVKYVPVYRESLFGPLNLPNPDELTPYKEPS